MANARATRTDDTTGTLRNIATVRISESGEDRDFQRVILADPDDGTNVEVIAEGSLGGGLRAYVADHAGATKTPRVSSTTGNLQVDAWAAGSWPVSLSGTNPVTVQNEVTVKQSTAANLLVTATVSGTPNVAVTNRPTVFVDHEVVVKQSTAANLLVTATISGTPNVAVTNTPGMTVQNEVTVKQSTAANLLVTATVSGTPNVAVTNRPTVFVDHEVVVKQSTSGNLKATVILTDGTDTASVSTTGYIEVLPVHARTLKRQVQNGSTSGGFDVVAAVASKAIKVYQYAIQATGTTNAYLKDGAGNQLTLNWNLQAREGAVGGAVPPPTYLFKTAAGAALQIVLSAAVTTGVEVSYWDDDAA